MVYHVNLFVEKNGLSPNLFVLLDELYLTYSLLCTSLIIIIFGEYLLKKQEYQVKQSSEVIIRIAKVAQKYHLAL
jgi:hypothetical protein